MGRIFGTRSARERAALYSDKPDVNPVYPELPITLLRMIYEGEKIQVSQRANGYAVLLGQSFVNADDVSLSKWLLQEYGSKLDSEQFQLSCTLLGERIRHEILNYERMTRQAEREERRAATCSWTSGSDLTSFFGR